MVASTSVTQIRPQEETVESYIKSFYEVYSMNSESTAVAYRKGVEKFLEFAAPLGVKTPIEQIPTILTFDKISSFRQHERDRKLKATSINRNVTALKEFGKHLHARGIEVNLSFFDSLKNLKGDGDSYEVLSIPEARKIAEWLKDNEKNKPIMKYYFTLLAIDSGIRADAISRLTPSNFIERDGYVEIKGVDKGKKSYSKQISEELYEGLKENFEWGAKKQKIFSISAKNRSDMMKRALKGLGWEDRNIAFHSFKKAAVNYAYQTTGDIMVAMRTGNHSSVATTQRYLDKGDDFMGAISNGNLDKIKELEFKDFSQEQLISAIEQLSDNAQYQLKNNLLKMVAH